MDKVVADSVPNNDEPQVKTADDYFGYEPNLFDENGVDNKDSVKEDSESNTKDTQTVINDILKTVKVDDKGKFIYPEGISPELRAAVAATKSFRDTQSSYTKTQQELKALRAEADELKSKVSQYETPTSGLTQEEQRELNELKFVNPDEWYKRMQSLEADKNKRVDDELKEVAEKAKAKTAEELREEALNKFNEGVEVKLTKEELIANTPPIWQNRVVSGEMSMEDYLTKAYAFIHADRVVQSPTVSTATNLNDVPGGSKEKKSDEGIDYNKITF